MSSSKTQKPIILITGSSSGFGRALVRPLLERGFIVLATMRDAASRRQLFEAELAVFGDSLKLIELDLAKSQDREALPGILERETQGRLDVLVNNAGFGLFGALEDLSETQIRDEMEVNFISLTLLTRDLLPALRVARGRAIFVSSLLGFQGLALTSLYCASKHALEGLVESLYFELKPQGVQVCLIEPGRFKTGFNSKIHWGEKTFSAESVYSETSRRSRDYRKNIHAASAPEPAPVVDAILSACTARKIPLRIRCGKDTRSVYWVRRILPESLYLSLMTFVFKRAT